MSNQHRETYVVMRDPNCGSPEAHILENATVEDAKQYIKAMVDDEISLDSSYGWKTTVVCNEEEWDYILLTETPTTPTIFETRICVMEINKHKHFE